MLIARMVFALPFLLSVSCAEDYKQDEPTEKEHDFEHRTGCVVKLGHYGRTAARLTAGVAAVGCVGTVVTGVIHGELR